MSSKLPCSLRHRASREILGDGCNARLITIWHPGQLIESMHGIVDQLRLVDPSTPACSAVSSRSLGTNTQHHNQEARTTRIVNSKGQPLLVPPKQVLGQGPRHRTTRSSFRRSGAGVCCAVSTPVTTTAPLGSSAFMTPPMSKNERGGEWLPKLCWQTLPESRHIAIHPMIRQQSRSIPESPPMLT